MGAQVAELAAGQREAACVAVAAAAAGRGTVVGALALAAMGTVVLWVAAANNLVGWAGAATVMCRAGRPAAAAVVAMGLVILAAVSAVAVAMGVGTLVARVVV